MRDRITLLLLFLLGLCGRLQAATDGDVVGRVLDDEGNPIVGARVTLVGDTAAVVTDADGRFRFALEKDARAERVRVAALGFETRTFVLKTEEGRAVPTLRMTPDAATFSHAVVTATRTPKALKDVPVVTRVITAAEIRQADATNIQDLLTEQLPGLEFGYAMSQETSLNMNGFGGNAVLFLVDGERLAGETMDNVDYNRLNLDNAGRIEIVKGAASALYGANAVAGVVNIITRESSEPWTANLNTRYRDFGREWRNGATFSFNKGRWNSQTNIQHTKSRTEKLTGSFDTESDIKQVYGGQTLNVKERLVFRANDRLRFIARGSYFARTSTRTNYDDHYKDYSGGLRAVVDFSPKSNLEVSYAYDQYDKARYVGGERTHDHDYSNRQHVLHALFSQRFAAHTLTVGADFLNDYLTTYQFLNNEHHRQASADAFAQFDYNPLRWLNVVTSLRYDYFSASSADALTARVALMAKWDAFSLRANYAGGFRAPSLKEMYMNFDMANIMMIYGNPDLDPERSHNFNVAFEHSRRISSSALAGTYTLTLMGFYNKYNNRITTDDFPGDETREEGSIYCNERGVKVCGIDLSGQYRADFGLGLKFNYNFQHIAGRSVDSQFSQPRPHSATWRIDFERQLCSFYTLNAALTGRYLSEPDTRLKDHDSAYTLWKFSLQQRFWEGISLNFQIDNLFNYRPQVYHWSSCMTKGRTWTLGLSLDLDRFIKAL